VQCAMRKCASVMKNRGFGSTGVKGFGRMNKKGAWNNLKKNTRSNDSISLTPNNTWNSAIPSLPPRRSIYTFLSQLPISKPPIFSPFFFSPVVPYNLGAIRKTTLTNNKSTILAIHRARRSHIANNRKRESGGSSVRIEGLV